MHNAASGQELSHDGVGKHKGSAGLISTCMAKRIIESLVTNQGTINPTFPPQQWPEGHFMHLFIEVTRDKGRALERQTTLNSRS